MPSFSIALTGLQADSVALSTIGNNLANLNTTAFKEQSVNFADMFYQNVGSSGSDATLQVGIGTRVSSIDSDFSQGTLATASSSSSMALNGNGFFVVNQGGTAQLTRTGNFQLNATGDLVTSDGYGVQGYPASDGAINLNATLQTMNIPIAKTQPAHATTECSFTSNLNSAAATGSTFTAGTSMYDSLGGAHDVTVTFTKISSNEWSYNVAMPAGDAASTTGNTGTLTFNSDGTLASPANDISGIGFSGLSDNASNMTLSWKLRDANGNSLITQSAATSSTNSSSQNGYSSGTYKSFTVDSTGVITATYSNGGTEVLGQVAVATVSNPQALLRNGGNLYSTDSASGWMSVGIAGSGGRGVIADSALEQSNVDISTEFAKLIVAQRAFEANSKTVTAFDTVTQGTINMIR